MPFLHDSPVASHLSLSRSQRLPDPVPPSAPPGWLSSPEFSLATLFLVHATGQLCQGTGHVLPCQRCSFFKVDVLVPPFPQNRIPTGTSEAGSLTRFRSFLKCHLSGYLNSIPSSNTATPPSLPYFSQSHYPVYLPTDIYCFVYHLLPLESPKDRDFVCFFHCHIPSAWVDGSMNMLKIN